MVCPTIQGCIQGIPRISYGLKEQGNTFEKNRQIRPERHQPGTHLKLDMTTTELAPDTLFKRVAKLLFRRAIQTRGKVA